jgi:hypothetical protein
MTETGFGCAVQCGAKEAHHLRHSDMLVEIIDPRTGRQLPPGLEGEVTVTTFAHEAAPLLRYRTGDVASAVDGTCPCGEVFPRLGKVKGRADNFICRRKNGGVSLGEMDETIYDFDGVLGYHVKAEADGSICFFVDADGMPDRVSFENTVRGAIGNVRAEFSYDYSAPFSTSKKRRVER